LHADTGTIVEGTEISGCMPDFLATLEDVTRMEVSSVDRPPTPSALGWTPAAGARAMLRIPELPDKTFAGRVVSWAPHAVVAEIGNPERLLRAGMKGSLVVEGPP